MPAGLFGTLHECGHGLYEQGVGAALERTPLAGGASLGVHESQSRLWEILVGRARRIERFFSQPFFVAEAFTNMPGKYVEIPDTVRSCKDLVEGKYDHLPEQAFMYIGVVEEAVEAAERLAASVK